MRPLQNKNISQPTSGTMTLHQKKKKNSQKQNSWFKKQEKKKERKHESMEESPFLSTDLF